jgi:large subunit ribosomal protein L22
MIEVRAQLMHLRMSPKKVRLVANTIKGLPVSDALTRLQFIQKAPSPIIAKLVRSAVANAIHNNHLTEEVLAVKSIVVEEGVALKRWRPAAFGTAHQFKKRGSHIKLVLGLKAGATAPKAAAARAAGPTGAVEKTDASKETAKDPVPAKQSKRKVARSAKKQEKEADTKS